MATYRPTLRLTVALSLAGAIVGLARGADSLGDTPFSPPPAATAAPTAGTPNAPLELRGIMVEGDSTMFSIYDPTRHSSTWTKLNEAGGDYIVRSYDAPKDTVTLDYQGRSLTLVLKTAKVVSGPAMPMPIAAANQFRPPTAPPIGGPVVLNPTPADEQRRLEAIAAEVNRRRMIRMQALQASREGRPPGAPPPNTARPR